MLTLVDSVDAAEIRFQLDVIVSEDVPCQVPIELRVYLDVIRRQHEITFR